MSIFFYHVGIILIFILLVSWTFYIITLLDKFDKCMDKYLGEDKDDK